MVMAPSAITTTYEETYESKRYSKTLKLIPDKNGGKFNQILGLTSKEAVLDVMKEQIGKINVDSCQPGEEDAFYVADLGEVYRQHVRWKMNLSRVKPFYGKLLCNSDRMPVLISSSRQM
jgi:ornithine decarboxylase